MFASYEHPPVSPALSSCDMESIDEMPSPPVTAQHSINDDLTINTTALQNSISLRFKVRRKYFTIKIYFFLFKKKRKRKLEPDTVSLRSLEEIVSDHFQRKKRLSLPRLSSVSELLSPMCDRVINMLQTTKQSSSANLHNLLNSNNNTNHSYNIRRKASSSQQTSNGISSPNTIKKFRAAWSETCDG